MDLGNVGVEKTKNSDQKSVQGKTTKETSSCPYDKLEATTTCPVLDEISPRIPDLMMNPNSENYARMERFPILEEDIEQNLEKYYEEIFSKNAEKLEFN